MIAAPPNPIVALRRAESIMGTIVSIDVRPPLVDPDVLDAVFNQLRAA